MSDSRGGATGTWLVLVVIWVAIAAFDFYTAP
jgi:hypothetical protein